MDMQTLKECFWRINGIEKCTWKVKKFLQNSMWYDCKWASHLRVCILEDESLGEYCPHLCSEISTSVHTLPLFNHSDLEFTHISTLVAIKWNVIGSRRDICSMCLIISLLFGFRVFIITMIHNSWFKNHYLLQRRDTCSVF